MKQVDIIGAGITKFGKHPEETGRDLLASAFKEAVENVDKGIDIKKDIKGLFVGYFTPEFYEHQGHIGALAAEWLGLSGIPAFRTESACASGSAALTTGYWAVASGMYDIVAVAGVEKMTNLSTEEVTDALSIAADNIYELPTGITFPGLFALMAQEYFEKYNETWEDLQYIALKNHHNGSLNPKAQFQAEIMDIADKIAKKKGVEFKSEMEFLKSKYNPIIAYPLRLFDCSPISDGASVALLANAEISKNFTDKPVRIRGIGLGTDTIAIAGRPDLTTSKATINAANAAYKMAGVKPKDIDIAEVHDCFTINEAILTEDLGFFKRGEGIKAAKEGRTAISGDIPVNTDGGLKSKGHPVGATGIAMVYEIWRQLRREAEKRQVKKNLNLGLTCNVGGSTASAVVTILERR